MKVEPIGYADGWGACVCVREKGVKDDSEVPGVRH